MSTRILPCVLAFLLLLALNSGCGSKKKDDKIPLTGTGTGPFTGTGTVPLPPRITTEAVADGEAGAAYSFQLMAEKGYSPLAWFAESSLPPGISLSSDGELFGTPGTVGNFNFTVKVEDFLGRGENASFTMAVHQSGALWITTTELPEGIVGNSYSFQLEATNGTPPYTWTNSGDLPGGLLLGSDGLISGTPSLVFSRTFTVTVEDSLSETDFRTFTLDTFSPSPGRITDRYHVGELKIEGIDQVTDNRYDWGNCIMQLDNGMYQMWWVRKHPTQGRDTIHYAWGYDSFHWYGDQQVLYPEDTTHERIHVARPSVVLVNGTYYMAYESNWELTDTNSNVNLATSSDGITWTKYPRMIPGRESDPVESIVTYYPDPHFDNCGYGVGQPCLLYKDGEFIMYYVDGTDTTGFGVPFNGMRRAVTTDPLNWDGGNAMMHPVVMWSAGVQFAYHPGIDRMMSLCPVNSDILIDTKPVRKTEVYFKSSIDPDGSVWNPKASWHYDHDDYRVTADEPDDWPRLKWSPSFVRDEHGWLVEKGRAFETLTIVYTIGELPLPGEDWKKFHYTWDLYMKLVKLDIFECSSIAFPSGMNLREEGTSSLFHMFKETRHPYINLDTLNKMNPGRENDILDVDFDYIYAMPGGLYWLENHNIQNQGTSALFWINDFTVYSYSNWDHFISYPGQSGMENVSVLTQFEFDTATAGMSDGGVRP